MLKRCEDGFVRKTIIVKKIIRNSKNVNIGTANCNNKSHADKELLQKLDICYKEIEHLKKQIELKDKIIELLGKNN